MEGLVLSDHERLDQFHPGEKFRPVGRMIGAVYSVLSNINGCETVLKIIYGLINSLKRKTENPNA